MGAPNIGEIFSYSKPSIILIFISILAFKSVKILKETEHQRVMRLSCRLDFLSKNNKEEKAVMSEIDLLRRDSSHLIHPLHAPSAHLSGKVWDSGEGSFLQDVDGNRFIDGLSGLWNNTAGNGRVELAEAAATQMKKMGYASGYIGSTNLPAIELSERLAAITYPNINHFYFKSYHHFL